MPNTREIIEKVRDQIRAKISPEGEYKSEMIGRSN